MQSNIGAQTGSFFKITSIGNFMVQLIDAVIIFGAIAVFFYLLMGGIGWLTSGGDKAKVEESQKRITGAIVGLAILASTYVIYRIVLRFFGLEEAISLPG